MSIQAVGLNGRCLYLLLPLNLELQGRMYLQSHGSRRAALCNIVGLAKARSMELKSEDGVEPLGKTSILYIQAAVSFKANVEEAM